MAKTQSNHGKQSTAGGFLKLKRLANVLKFGTASFGED